MVIRGVVLAATGLALGCGPSGGTVSLVLDIPNSMLDPKGFTSVEVRLHHPDGDREINVAVDSSGAFDLGEVDAQRGVLVEAALRTESGAAVGYGRAAAPVVLTNGERIVIPVRRPIIYFAGLVAIDPDPNMTNDLRWFKAKPTFADLTGTATFDGSTKLAENAVLTISAGPNLYIADQAPTNPNGTLTGMPTIKSVSTVDHAVANPPLSAMLDGAVVDGAGSDDGAQLLVATTTHLYVIATATGLARPIADGSFARVAIVTAADGALTAVAIRNRSDTGACTAELVWALVNSDDTNNVTTIATGGFTDVAADAGRAFYVDSCKGELGEATGSGVSMLRAGLMPGKPTALAVDNGQAWIGLERMGTTTAPAQMALVAASLVGSDAPRMIFDEPATQIVEATDPQYRGVLRRLDASKANFLHLEIGAGGDYVAMTLAAVYHGDAIPDAFFPEMDIESQELRVIEASTGAPVQKYRSWCDGTITLQSPFELFPWGCSTAPGQSAPPNIDDEHRISSMTFQYGKK